MKLPKIGVLALIIVLVIAGINALALAGSFDAILHMFSGG